MDDITTGLPRRKIAEHRKALERHADRLFRGLPDIQHSLQALLIPLHPATGSLTAVIPKAGRPALRG